MVVALVVIAMILAGCQDAARFRTDSDEVYKGRVFGERDESCDYDCSFIRRSFSENTVLTMTYNPLSADLVAGRISTTSESCGPSLDNVELIEIAPLAHDQLSLLEFPGRSRVRNYIYAARPQSGPMAGRDPMVFVSLMQDGGIEVRIIVGSGANGCDPDDCATLSSGECDYFGVFSMKRESL
ncbi:MAG: hypothetical protein R3A47_03050 [Polyangiales bacterium]